MKSSLLVAACAALSATSFGQTDKPLQSHITSATVYNDRALVLRSASGTFAVGTYNVKLVGLPLLLNNQSVRVSGRGTAHAKILDVRVDVAQVDSVPDSRVRELQTKRKQLDDEMRKLNDRATVLNQQREFLNRISIASSDNISKDLRVQRPTVDDWQRVMSFLEASRTKFEAEQREIDAKRDEVRKKQNDIQFDINALGTPQQPREKHVVVQVDVAREGKLNLDITYLIQNASWEPLYDLRALTSEKKVELTYNAMVWQHTGEEWKDITLVLSTAQPIVGGSEPTLATWFIDVYGGTKGAIQGFVRDIASGDPLAGVNVTIDNTTRVGTTNADGFFVIQEVEPGNYSLRVSFVGYKTKTVQVSVAPYQTTRIDLPLDVIPVDIEGIAVRAERPKTYTSNATVASPVEASREDVLSSLSKMSVPIASEFVTARLQSGVTSSAFQVGAKATVPSNNAKRKVTITVASLPAEFRYSSVPKMQPHAYFKTTVQNTTAFPFLEGAMSVFVDEDYLSSSKMPAVMPGEQFDASLGVDDGIRVERKLLNKLTATTGFFSKSKKTTYDIVITVENLKKTIEKITIRDNVPVSRHEKIKVEIESPNPNELKPTAEGVLVWMLELKPSEKRALQLRFSIEYPTDMTVSAME
jgi:hypothetical protein